MTNNPTDPNDHLPGGYTGESDTTPTETISEAMQGATGEADANGLGRDFDSGDKLGELKDNLGDVAEKS